MKAKLLALALMAALSAPAHAILACSSADDNYDDPDAGPDTGTITTVTWLVGQPTPDLNIGPEQYVTCAATGAELAAIIVKFPNLPQRKNSTLTIWRGESAVFILDNL